MIVLNYNIFLSAVVWTVKIRAYNSLFNRVTEVLPSLPDNVTFTELGKKSLLEYREWGCLSNTDFPHAKHNRWMPYDASRSKLVADRNFMTGTTFWINEHMAVGHVMYDIILLETLRTTLVDRIVLQRSPCINADLCLGLGTWAGFFRSFYAAAIDAFQPGVALFVRFVPKVTNIVPIYLTTNTSGDAEHEYKPYHSNFKNYTLTNRNCFERVIRRSCMWTCAHSRISASTAMRFKESAYKLVRDVKLMHHFISNQPIRVLLAYRCKQASRRMANVRQLQKNMMASLRPPQYDVHFNCTSTYSMTAEEQIKMVASANIVIAEHGAFQSNMIYMRKGAMFVELRGNYVHGEFKLFEQLAQMFGLAYAYVITTNLQTHRGIEFNITADQIQSAIKIIKTYANQHFNFPKSPMFRKSFGISQEPGSELSIKVVSFP